MIKAMTAKQITLEAKEIKRLEEIKAEIERQAKFTELVEKTIEFCDTTISLLIDKTSRDGKDHITFYWGAYNWNGFDNVFSELHEEKDCYANGDSSYEITGATFHVPTLCDYLVKNGYEVRQYDWSYKKYGFGAHSGTEVRVEWDS